MHLDYPLQDLVDILYGKRWMWGGGQLLPEQEEYVKDKACFHLRRYTSQNFGDDAPAWESWITAHYSFEDEYNNPIAHTHHRDFVLEFSNTSEDTDLEGIA